MRKLFANISTCWNFRFQHFGLSARLPTRTTVHNLCTAVHKPFIAVLDPCAAVSTLSMYCSTLSMYCSKLSV